LTYNVPFVVSFLASIGGGFLVDLFYSMSVFKRVAEAKSFTQVANELGTSQPTISKHVAFLEKRLQIKLLNRSTRQLSLTEVGQSYYEHCSRIVDDLVETEASVSQIKSAPSGSLRITATVLTGQHLIAPILWKFMQKYPEIKIDFILEDKFTDLVKDGVDIAIRAGELSESNYIAKKLASCPQILVASPDYINQHGEPKTLNDLAQHNCLYHSVQPASNLWHFNSVKGKESVRVNGYFISNNRETLDAAALSGVGIAFTSLWSNRKYLQNGELVQILPEYKLNNLDLYAVYQQRKYTPSKVRGLIEFLSDGLNKVDIL